MSAAIDILRLAATAMGVWCLMALPLVALILGLELMFWMGDMADAPDRDDD